MHAIILNTTSKLHHAFHLRCRSLRQLPFCHLVEVDYRSDLSALRACAISFISVTWAIFAYFDIWLTQLGNAIAIVLWGWELEICSNYGFTERLCLVLMDVARQSFWVDYFLFLDGSVSESGLFSWLDIFLNLLSLCYAFCTAMNYDGSAGCSIFITRINQIEVIIRLVVLMLATWYYVLFLLKQESFRSLILLGRLFPFGASLSIWFWIISWNHLRLVKLYLLLFLL